MFARNESEANDRFLTYQSKDPFEKIAPSLLNSADVIAYVEKTGMIFPFDKSNLKGAAYEVPIEGEVIFWDVDSGEKKTVKLEKDGDYFDLEPNSIAFVTLQPVFRMPYYMALRFNLTVTQIYKG